jgi:hypothetical protein
VSTVWNPAPVDRLVAVYPDRGRADRAAAAVRDASPGAATRVDDPHDRVAALHGEMREESELSFISPQAGVFLTKEMTKSVLLLVPVGAVIGAVIAAPLAAFAFRGTSLGVRLVWAVVIGATMGGTIATIVGAALAARGPADQSAGHVGVPVRVTGDVGREVVDALVRVQPIRVDAFAADGTPLATVTTEEEADPGGIFEHLHHQFTQPRQGDWSSARVDDLPDLQARNREVQRAANEPDPDSPV